MAMSEAKQSTDAELLARAAECGWQWLENQTTRWGSPKYPAFGWQKSPNSFQHCSPDDKIACLKAHVNCMEKLPARGFDHEHRCGVCGKPIWLHWYKDVEDELIARSECHSCNFWMALIRSRVELIIVDRVEGRQVYTVGPKKEPGPFNGFGGHKWTIRFLDGRTVETCDLWHRGEVPSPMASALPINAVLA